MSIPYSNSYLNKKEAELRFSHIKMAVSPSKKRINKNMNLSFCGYEQSSIMQYELTEKKHVIVGISCSSILLLTNFLKSNIFHIA